MATKEDKDRKHRKAEAVAAKIKEVAPHADMIIGMLDETKLDMILLAFGVGSVTVESN
ncbi:hypothetical protein [Mesorhizobium denitrificans]|jgi:hypothetical protein|uniref:hypothetical protein n=1 Tax=Mesorhizobium denitrificans TaxID=2294114 RepID=UPI001313EE45|nr:hypothetical protein [Mesorhizobium denitrificans]MCC0018416.1 hypothetical protein [Rhodobiaceae bacterium]